MGAFIIKWFVNIISLFAVVNFVPGINVDNGRDLVVAAFVLGLVNAVLRPFIILLTLPINVISLGILTFFINAFLFYAVSKAVKGFYVLDFWSAFWGAMWFSFASFLVNLLINPKRKTNMRRPDNVFHGRTRRGNVIDVEARHEKETGGKNEQT